ncbi:MAG: hypothetical protein HGB12_08265 [Bacteroidetes bacterium]|nr:hypothetical protein [Bacteroidota bacterium]
MFAQKGKIELKLNLRDGNIISGTSESISTVTLNTDFGKLDIPIKNVSAIQFGITPDISSKSKIVNLIKQMNDPTPEKRQAAYEELVKMSINTIPVINDYIYGSEYQTGEFTDYTPEAALTEMKGTYNLDEGFNNKDVVSIDYEYTIGGTFNLKSISLKTEFGLLDVPKEKIKNVEISYFDEQSGDKSYKLLASKHISGNDNGGWLNTGVKVKTGQKIAINATGEITLESLSGNKYTPDGNATSDVESTNESSYPTYGNVVYKIGESGEMIKAGSKYSGKAKDSGTLFLSIYETVYNSANTGTYSVKVSLK